MPVKEWCRKHQPIQLYVILFLTIVFFAVELVVSHITHALTLLMNSYQMLCNILALTGYIITIKKLENKQTEPSETKSLKLNEEIYSISHGHSHHHSKENKLKNTFGWARIDVISMLICCVFLGSLCFSLLVEALQTLVHLDHLDEMHHPVSVLCLGVAGILLNGVCFMLIGGYSFHQGSFLYVNSSGDVVLNKVAVGNSVRQGSRRISKSRITLSPPLKQRQGVKEMLRDVLGCVLVIICAGVILIVEKDVAKYVDPILSIFSALSLVYLSWDLMKESCLILLQTMPASINIDQLKTELLKHFPDVINIHDFHVWQLTASKVISTVHIKFQNPKVYAQILNEIKEFFIDNGITQVTIQPEFYTKSVSTDSLSKKEVEDCLMKCQSECVPNLCCPDIADDLGSTKSITSSKETIPGCGSMTNLKSVKILPEETNPSPSSSRSASIDSHTLLNQAEQQSNIINCTKQEFKEGLEVTNI